MELKEFEVGLGQMFEDGSPVVIAVDENNNPRLLGKEKVYLKSEADEYIGELKKERDWLAKDRAQAYDDLEKRAQLNIKQEESIRHHKYKLCLAMARWCDDAARLSTWDSDYHRCGWYNKWMQRWLKIAEKFNEAK